ncbi:MAG: PilZ domain-containing protein, partial [Nitrospinota bacterium]
ARGVGFTRDLARGGAMFSTDIAPDPTSLLKLWLFLAPAAQPIETVGEVRWVAPQRRVDLFDVGVRFEAGREEDLARMVAHVPVV